MFAEQLKDFYRNTPAGLNLTETQLDDLVDDAQAGIIRAARETGLFPPVSATSVPEREIPADALLRITNALRDHDQQIGLDVDDLRVSAFGTLLSNLLFTTGTYGYTQGNKELELKMVPPSKRAKLIAAMLRALVIEANCME